MDLLTLLCCRILCRQHLVRCQHCHDGAEPDTQLVRGLMVLQIC